MTRTTLFRANRTQAVPLPRDVAFPESVTEVVVLRDGPRRLIVPAGSTWDDFFDAPGIDLPDRDQPALQHREAFQVLQASGCAPVPGQMKMKRMAHRPARR